MELIADDQESQQNDHQEGKDRKFIVVEQEGHPAFFIGQFFVLLDILPDAFT